MVFAGGWCSGVDLRMHWGAQVNGALGRVRCVGFQVPIMPAPLIDFWKA
jgi:hypothetical protein